MAWKLWQTYEGVDIFQLAEHGSYGYATDHIALDADGSPRAYRPDDTGLDALVNAGYPHKGWQSVLVADPEDPSQPYVQPSGSNVGCFVSKTSLYDHRALPTDPAAYADAETIPYIVFPGAFYALKGTGSWGDFAMVRNLGNGHSSAAIVADGGPSKAPLGEISLALASALGGNHPNPRNGAGAPKGRLQYLIFPGSKREPAWPLALDQIIRNAGDLLNKIGGWPAI